MQKLGLLTLSLRRATVTLPASQIAPSGEGLRKVGLATYSSTQPYRDELGIAAVGCAKTRRIGLLTLS